MNLILERTELAVLVLHLNIMRKPIKKGFKSNYGPSEGRNMIKLYDGIKERLQDELNEEIDPIIFIFDEKELYMLHSFINWYLLEVNISAEEQHAEIDKDEQIIILDSIKKKVNVLVDMLLEEVILSE